MKRLAVLCLAVCAATFGLASPAGAARDPQLCGINVYYETPTYAEFEVTGGPYVDPTAVDGLRLTCDIYQVETGGHAWATSDGTPVEAHVSRSGYYWGALYEGAPVLDGSLSVCTTLYNMTTKVTTSHGCYVGYSR